MNILGDAFAKLRLRSMNPVAPRRRDEELEAGDRGSWLTVAEGSRSIGIAAMAWWTGDRGAASMEPDAVFESSPDSGRQLPHPELTGKTKPSEDVGETCRHTCLATSGEKLRVAAAWCF